MKKILIIEDELMVRENLTDLLMENNYNAIPCENGFIGAMAAHENEPDLILCDVMMPDMDGFEVLQALRLNSSTKSVPFLFLTALNDVNSIRKGMNLGANDFLTKPYKIEDLLRAIEIRLTISNHVNQIASNKFKQKAINKIFIALYAIGNTKSESKKEEAIHLLQIVCAEEINFFSQSSELLESLSPDDVELFMKLKGNLVSKSLI
jgi:DNA-binding response OmpR family regulator